ncbi:uncharacterized protein LOC111713328 isoform X2 [Eurytemora carolleeae]|uniref:uncharacterized protein LOC111713328 isoform X2 n=1 Tax=Eurytemora carolleeae TaxID=1294199 RepID=UPI000C7563F3|nr:uncharacterized protein LOC111713328 isoform X2 [Eurytemora carolleeae]|eukprot:XP_023343937.1 uncharacterized protein LOC111713328 isoform X2 [Eurytemora affinis]
MAGNMKKEILEEEVRIEEENVCIKEEVSSPFTIEDTCTVYVHGGDNTENIEINDILEVDEPHQLCDKEFEILNPLEPEKEEKEKIEDRDEIMKTFMFKLHKELRKDMKELKQELKNYIDKKFSKLKDPECEAPASNTCRVHQGMVKGEETLVNLEMMISQFPNELEVLKEAMMHYNSPREFFLFIGTYESYVDLTAERFREVCPTFNNLLLATFGGVNAASRRAARAKSRIADRKRKKERRKEERESRENGGKGEKKKKMVKLG